MRVSTTKFIDITLTTPVLVLVFVATSRSTSVVRGMARNVESMRSSHGTATVLLSAFSHISENFCCQPESKLIMFKQTETMLFCYTCY